MHKKSPSTNTNFTLSTLASLDALLLGHKVVGIASAAPEQERLADPSGGIVSIALEGPKAGPLNLRQRAALTTRGSGYTDTGTNYYILWLMRVSTGAWGTVFKARCGADWHKG